MRIFPEPSPPPSVSMYCTVTSSSWNNTQASLEETNTHHTWRTYKHHMHKRSPQRKRKTFSIAQKLHKNIYFKKKHMRARAHTHKNRSICTSITQLLADIQANQLPQLPILLDKKLWSHYHLPLSLSFSLSLLSLSLSLSPPALFILLQASKWATHSSWAMTYQFGFILHGSNLKVHLSFLIFPDLAIVPGPVCGPDQLEQQENVLINSGL